jgi:hypothetical protein
MYILAIKSSENLTQGYGLMFKNRSIFVYSVFKFKQIYYILFETEEY